MVQKENKSCQLHLRLPLPLMERLRQEAERAGVSKVALVRIVLREGLDRRLREAREEET